MVEEDNKTPEVEQEPKAAESAEAPLASHSESIGHPPLPEPNLKGD